jgi:hypothetical protein
MGCGRRGFGGEGRGGEGGGRGWGSWVLKDYRRNPSLVSYVSTTVFSVFGDSLPESNKLFARRRGCFEQNVES